MQALLHAAGFLLLATFSSLCHSQSDAGRAYPAKMLRLVVPYAAGGGNDIVARVVGQRLSEGFGQPVVVENRLGADGFIAGEFVKKADPDGYTVLIGATGMMAISQATYSKPPISTLKDFAPVTMIGSFPLILVVGPSLPVRSVSELVQHARSHPSQMNYGSSSAMFQLVSELFNQRTGTSFQQIPYKGTNLILNAVMSGEVTMVFSDAPPAIGLLKSGKVRGLAVTSATRHASWPDLPTLSEAGVPDMDVILWMGLFVPAATPGAVVHRLRDAVAKALALPDVRERMAGLGMDPGGDQPEQFAKFVASEIARWTAVAKAANIHAD
jgi:tripartite-type tricarboxylate transporter receptor subunit TctC